MDLLKSKNEYWLNFFSKIIKNTQKKLWTYFILQLIGTSFKPCLWKLYNPNDIYVPRKKKNPSINKKDFPVPVSGFSHRKKRAPLFSLVSLTTLLSLLGKKFLLLFLFLLQIFQFLCRFLYSVMCYQKGLNCNL